MNDTDRQLVTLEDGRQAYFYPVGSVELRDASTGQIIKARGRIADSTHARALARARWDAVERAKWDGLAAAAAEHGLTVDGLAVDDMPAVAIARIVQRLAMSAIGKDDRTGNEAARIVLQLVGLLSDRGAASSSQQQQQPAPDGLQLTVGAELAARLMDALADIRRARDASQQPASPPASLRQQSLASGTPADTPAAASSQPTDTPADTRTHTHTPDTAGHSRTPHPTLVTLLDITEASTSREKIYDPVEVKDP